MQISKTKLFDNIKLLQDSQVFQKTINWIKHKLIKSNWVEVLNKSSDAMILNWGAGPLGGANKFPGVTSP